MRRIAVIGGASPLGRALIERLGSHPDVEHVRGIESRAPTDRRAAPELDVVSFVPDPRPLAEYFEKEGIDSVVHANLIPDRCGASARAREADVIGAMCLGAAIGQPGSPVRSWIVVSSSAIYPIGSLGALIHDERAVAPTDPIGIAASIAEAEDYARETARRLPHVNVAILRLQQLAGSGLGGALARLFARARVPAPLGFDPAIQWLHADDAVEAMVHAVSRELAGVFNVASAGLIRFGEAVRIAGCSSLPLLPVGAAPFEPLLGRLGLPYLPAELAALLRHGHAIDTAKLERTGWRPRFDQPACVAAIRAAGRPVARRRGGLRG